MSDIVVATLATREMETVWDIARQAWEPFLKKHSLKLFRHTELTDPSKSASWNKLHVVLDALRISDGPVWWWDCDIMPARDNVSIEDYNPFGLDLLVSQDWNGMCCALFRAANTDWTKRFLQAMLVLGDVQDPDEFGIGLGIKWEQNCLKLLYKNFPEVQKHVGLLPATWVNDQPEHAKPDDLFWHFSVRPNDVRVRQMMEKLVGKLFT